MIFRTRLSQNGRRIRAAITALILMSVTGSIGAETTWVITPTPATRPNDAPKIITDQHSAEWHAIALIGITAPVPESLRFLKDQGNWYTPFTRAGMVGPYDIRSWHSQK